MKVIWFLLLCLSCNPAPSAEDLDKTRGADIKVFFNDPGTRPENLWKPDALKVLIDLIDETQATLDFAVMGFTHSDIIEAVVRAYDRGVVVQMVGDAGHLYNSGYHRMVERHIPMVTGNLAHIMHHKFLISDRRFVFTGTANWSPTDMEMNSNNFVLIDSPPVASDFQGEFDQMWSGLFGHSKAEIQNGRSYTVGDTEMEVWFSPNEDALGRILELVDAAESSVRFTIFAFTKDQVGAAFIRKQEEFNKATALTSPPSFCLGTFPRPDDWEIDDDGDGFNEAEGDCNDDDPSVLLCDCKSENWNFRDRHSVAGLIDQSQLHSNGQYHEVYRLLTAGIPVRMDGLDNSRQPGDYQAGGGRLHSKTMVIDADGENPVVITGSFNWSASATISNDEYLLVMHGSRIAQLYDDYFESLWTNGRRLGEDHIDNDHLFPGDIVINEVMWYGAHFADGEGHDEFIELKNNTNDPVDLALWQLSNDNDFVVGFPPGSWVPPNGRFLILDHTLEAYIDGLPQDELSGYNGGNLVVNSFNDNRQSRLYIKDGILKLHLLDPDGRLSDVAGDGGPAFAGGPEGPVVRSMERRQTPGNGALAENWYSCTANQGGSHVNEAFQNTLLATPGEPNSDQ